MEKLADGGNADVFSAGEVVCGVDEALDGGERRGEDFAGAVVCVPAAHVRGYAIGNGANGGATGGWCGEGVLHGGAGELQAARPELLGGADDEFLCAQGVEE